MTRVLIGMLVLVGGVATAAAQDWPEFRGPGGQGHSPERGLPLEWSETRNVAWKTPLPGLGRLSPSTDGTVIWQQRLGGTYSASPVFADGRIYFLAEQGVTTAVFKD